MAEFFQAVQGLPQPRHLIRRAIEHGGLEEMGAVLDAIRSTGALDYTRVQAHAESRAACQAIATLPASRYREYLLELADFAVSRTY